MPKTMVLVDRDAFFDELQMVFDVQTTETLVRVLDRVAMQVLAAAAPRTDFEDLKRLVAELVEAQKETERRLQQLEKMMAELAAEHRQFMLTQERLIADIETMKTDVNGLKTDVSVLKTDVSVLKTEMVEVKADIKTLKTDVGKLKGDSLETKYRLRAPNYFGRLLRRPKVVDINTIVDQLENHLTMEEFDSVLLADLIVQGKPRFQTEKEKVWLVIEISSVIDANDVKRSRQRADFLSKAGFQAIPVAAGEGATCGAETEAHSLGVVILQDGRSFFWDEAVARL